MRLERDVQVTTRVVLDRIRHEYAELLQSPPFSLQQLFNPEGFRLDEYCVAFSPHPQSEEVQAMAEVFGKKYGIWLENAAQYITCTLYLFPLAPMDRILPIVKNNAIDYYLNDIAGRDLFRFLSLDDQIEMNEIISRMAELDENLELHPDAHGIEYANADVLSCIQLNSPGNWFKEFIRLFSYHIGVTHKDLNTKSLGYIPSPTEYIENRNHTSGMHHIIMLVEYNIGNFINWDALTELGIGNKLRRLHWLVATFGCLSNDLFSFEKEVIEAGTDSNLVMIIALNNPFLSLRETILCAAAVVRNILEEYHTLIRELKYKALNTSPKFQQDSQSLQIHISGLERCVQASWLWQVYTKRYKQKGSLWKETSL